MDLIRWRIAEDALTKPVLGMPDAVNQDRKKWPFPGTPTIDENGIALLKEQIKGDTRHFAKRQLTWFRREKEMSRYT